MTQTVQGALLIVFGLAAPVIGFVGVGLVVTPPPGMDSYVPAFLGGFVGIVIGLIALIMGMVMIVLARRQARREAIVSEP